MRARASSLPLLLLFAACRSAPSAPAVVSMPPPPPPSVQCFTVAHAASPILARVALGERAWVEVEVAGPEAPALDACARLAEGEVALAAQAGVSASVVRACARAPLPKLVVGTSSTVLASERRRTADDLALDALLRSGGRAGDADPSLVAVVTALSAHASQRACEVVRAELVEADRRQAEETEREARAFLEAQAREAEARAKAACDEVEAQAPVCRRGRRLDARRCELELERLRRACSTELTSLAVLRARSAEVAPPPLEVRRCVAAEPCAE